MKRIGLIFIPLFVSLNILSQSLPDAAPEIKLSDVSVAGYLGEKIKMCIENRVKAQDVNEVIAPFRHRQETAYWQTEFWGKWFTSAVSAYQYSKDPALKKIIDNAFEQLVATQSNDGYIGNYSDSAHLSGWDIWGRKYTLLGLIAYYDLTKNKKAIISARKLLDYTMQEVGPQKVNIVKTGNYSGMPSSSILEPVVLLYNRTGDKKYLEFAKYIVQQWEGPDGPKLISKALAGVPVAERFPIQNPNQWWTWSNGQKAYEMMSCYEGLLELYRITGEKTWLSAIDAVIENIINEEINICGSGASSECWYHGNKNQPFQAIDAMETCVTMTWMKLLVNIYKTTHDPKYIDQFETSMYNALLAAQHPSGNTFAQYTSLVGSRQQSPPQPGMQTLNCCIANGPRALMLIPQLIYNESANNIILNLYAESRADFVQNKTRVSIEQITDYPKGEKITIKVNPESESVFGVWLRIPSWSLRNKVMVNNEEIRVNAGDGYVKITRTWSAGDKIILSLDLRGRVIHSPDSTNHFIAIKRGPIVLCRDNRFETEYDSDEGVMPLSDSDNFIELIEAPHSSDIGLAYIAKFRVGSYLLGEKGKPVSLTLCDFASAGNLWNTKSRYRVWLPRSIDPTKK